MPKKQNQRQPAKSRKMPKSQPIQDYDEEEEEEYEEDQEEEEDELENNSFIVANQWTFIEKRQREYSYV